MPWQPFIQKTTEKTREFGPSFFPIPQIVTPNGEKIAIRLKDKENKFKVEILPNGLRKISLAYVIDNNQDPKDGRIYLLDQFTIDPKKNRLVDYNRFFTQIKGGNWQSWLEEYRKSHTPSKAEAEDHFFSISNLRDKEKLKSTPIAMMVPKIESAFYSQKNIFKKALQLVHETTQSNQIKIKLHDPQNHYQTITRNFTSETTLTMVVDNDSNPRNGRLLIHDRFVNGKSPSNYFRWERRWEGTGPMKKWADKLNQAWKETQRDRKNRLLSQTEGKNYYEAIKIIWDVDARVNQQLPVQPESSRLTPNVKPETSLTPKVITDTPPSSPLIPDDSEKQEKPIGDLKERLKLPSSNVAPFRFAVKFSTMGNEEHTKQSFLKTYGKLLQEKFATDSIKLNKINFLLILKVDPSTRRIRAIGFDKVVWDRNFVSEEQVQALLQRIADGLSMKYRLKIEGDKIKVPVTLIK